MCINRNNILLALQITSQHRVITAHQQLRELDRPISQIATRQWPHLGLDCILHILVVVFLVPERSQQIQHLVARILALFSERVDETLVKFGEEVADGPQTAGPHTIELLQELTGLQAGDREDKFGWGWPAEGIKPE